MSCLKSGLVFPALLAFTVSSQAATITLTFEDIQGMSVYSGGLIPVESRLSDQYLNDYGVVFRSGSPYAAITNLGLFHATSGTNGILATLDNGIRTNTVPISISFFEPGDSATPFVTNSVSARTDLWGTQGAYSATLTAYDVSGMLLGSVSVPDSNGQLLAFTAEGIHSFELSSTAPDTAAIAFDDVTFETPSAVPLPAAVWLFASGLLGFGLTSWKRQGAQTR
jgi:hypothetical protein